MGVIGLCLILNLVTVFAIFWQQRQVVQAQELVNQSETVLQQIADIHTGILETRLRKLDVPELQKTIQKFISTTESESALASDAKVLANLTDGQVLETEPDVSGQLIQKLSVSGHTHLTESLNVAQVKSDESSKTILLAAFINLILIASIFSFYLFSRRQWVEIQNSLLSALTKVESVNHEVRLNLVKKESQFKTAQDLAGTSGSNRSMAELMNDEPQDFETTQKMTALILKMSDSTLKSISSAKKPEVVEAKESVDLSLLSLLKATCASLEATASIKHQIMTINRKSDDYQLHAPKQTVQSIFIHVIGNALKFSEANTEVTLLCYDIGSSYKIEIKDQGPGFSQEDLVKLFSPGVKLSAKPVGHPESTGLGLFSAKESLALLGGTIEVSNHEDHGARVVISFTKKAS